MQPAAPREAAPAEETSGLESTAARRSAHIPVPMEDFCSKWSDSSDCDPCTYDPFRGQLCTGPAWWSPSNAQWPPLRPSGPPTGPGGLLAGPVVPLQAQWPPLRPSGPPCRPSGSLQTQLSHRRPSGPPAAPRGWSQPGPYPTPRPHTHGASGPSASRPVTLSVGCLVCGCVPGGHGDWVVTCG